MAPSPSPAVEKCVSAGLISVLAAPAASIAKAAHKTISQRGWLGTVTMALLAISEPALKLTTDADVTSINSGGKRVPIFYANYYAGLILEGRDYIPTLLAAAAGCIFGVIHTIAWSFDFPSRVEQIMWHTAALIVTIVPLIVSGGSILTMKIVLDWNDGDDPEGISFPLLVILIVASSVFYVLARITLFVQAIVALRALPATAFDAIPWITYIPHIN
jgi:hypothetical protein